MQQGAIETISSQQDGVRNTFCQTHEVLVYFLIESHPQVGTRVRDEQTLGQAIPQATLERLVMFVTKDLLFMQKLGMQQDEAEVQNPHFSKSTADMNRQGFTQRSKVTFLDEVSLALVSFFFSVAKTSPHSTSMQSQMHYAVTFVIGSPKDSPRLHFVFPMLQDRLLLTCKAVLRRIRTSGSDGGDNDKANLGLVFEWARYVTQIAAHTNGWLRAGITWQSIRSCDTILATLSEDSQMLRNLSGFVSAALEHHRCVVRADDEKLVVMWLNTLALFMQDSQLIMASLHCSRSLDQIVPDLVLQGTTCATSEIITLIPFFRRPCAVLDVSRRLDESAHLFPAFKLLCFGEYRVAALCSDKLDRFGSFRTRTTRAVVSPLIAMICGQVCCALTAKPSVSSTVITPSSTMPLLFRASIPELGNNGTVPEHRRNLNAEMFSPSRQESGVQPWFGVTPPNIVNSNNSNSNSNSDIRIENALLLLAHWRRQVQLRALVHIVAERNAALYLPRRRNSADVEDMTSASSHRSLGIHEADQRVLEVAVAFFAPIQEQKEEREREAIRHSFNF